MKRILGFIALIMFSSCAMAQVTPAISSTADAVHYRGAWTVGTTETALVDVKDSTADTSGYVNSAYIGGNFHLYSDAGFNIYEGTVAYEPQKFLAALMTKVAPNISADYVHFMVHGDVGDLVPTSGSPYITGGGGAEFGINLNSSGTAEWKIVRANWHNPGIWSVDSGITYTFLSSTSTATVQSAKMAKLRRALKTKLARPVVDK